MTDKKIELENAQRAIYQEWKTTTPEGRAFMETPYNLMVFYQDGVRRFNSVTVENLTLAYRKLSLQGYDFSKDAKPVKTIPWDAPATAPVETPEQRQARESAEKQAAFEADQKRERELFTEWEKRVGNENELQRLQRVTALKENYMRKKFPRAAPSKTPHPSTVRNTKADLKFRR